MNDKYICASYHLAITIINNWRYHKTIDKKIDKNKRAHLLFQVY